MVLPDEISSAAYDGDVDTVRRFLAQHPEHVNDVEEPDGHLAMLTVAIRLVVDPETRPRSLELVRLLISCGANVMTPWQKYCLVPPKELLRLRSQIARGKVVATRSTPPHLARLFSRSLPNEIAWRVLAFWNPRY